MDEAPDDPAKALADKLQALRAASPDREFEVAHGPLGPIIFGSPTRDNYLQYKIYQRSDSPMENAKAMDELMCMCAVDPNADALRATLKRLPGLSAHGDITRAMAIVCGTVTKK